VFQFGLAYLLYLGSSSHPTLLLWHRAFLISNDTNGDIDAVEKARLMFGTSDLRLGQRI
jgi:hypothetical protein